MTKSTTEPESRANDRKAWESWEFLAVEQFFKSVKPVDMQSLLADGDYDADASDESGNTPLHWAARVCDDAEIVKALIEGGAQVNARNNQGSTPLHLASEFNANKHIIAMLIWHHAEVNSKDDNRNKILCDREIELNANHADLSMLAFIIHQKKQYPDSAFNYETGNTCLHYAARNENPEIIDVLVKSGADVNARNNGKSTPLHFAMMNLESESAEKLIEYGADVNVSDEYGYALIHRAAGCCEYSKHIALLIEHNCNIHVKDDFQNTPLHYAAKNSKLGGLGIMEVLLEHGHAVDPANGRGQTPLHYISGWTDPRYSADSDMIKLLVDHGADVNARDHYGNTPLHWAAKVGKTESIQLLISLGAGPDAKNDGGQKPIDLVSPIYPRDHKIYRVLGG